IAGLASSLQLQTEHTIEEKWSWRDGNAAGYDYSELNDEEDSYEDEQEENNNLQIQVDSAEDEDTCEYSCPRYYRPVCVLRNGEPLTFATPCEFYNEVRCASVQQRKGHQVPHFQYLHNGSC
ncbi:hypothetical protein KR054_008627, partial [Drosophila jambulina]